MNRGLDLQRYICGHSILVGEGAESGEAGYGYVAEKPEGVVVGVDSSCVVGEDDDSAGEQGLPGRVDMEGVVHPGSSGPVKGLGVGDTGSGPKGGTANAVRA